MKFLVDMPVTPDAVPQLQAAGHDAVHALRSAVTTIRSSRRATAKTCERPPYATSCVSACVLLHRACWYSGRAKAGNHVT